MSLGLSSVPLAFAAGALGILSPCVWPLVPAVMASSATAGRVGPWFLGLGLCVSFAAAGTVLTYLLLRLGLHPDTLRTLASALLLIIGLVLVSQALGARVSGWLSRISSRLGGGPDVSSASGQFAVGAMLGLVWLPCVGPTLGAAIALASLGQSVALAFLVMLAFGAGTAAVLLAAAVASGAALNRWRPGIMARAETGKKILGWTLLALAAMVFTGIDKVLEIWALGNLPDWAISL